MSTNRTKSVMQMTDKEIDQAYGAFFVIPLKSPTPRFQHNPFEKVSILEDRGIYYAPTTDAQGGRSKA